MKQKNPTQNLGELHSHKKRKKLLQVSLVSFSKMKIREKKNPPDFPLKITEIVLKMAY